MAAQDLSALQQNLDDAVAEMRRAYEAAAGTV